MATLLAERRGDPGPAEVYYFADPSLNQDTAITNIQKSPGLSFYDYIIDTNIKISGEGGRRMGLWPCPSKSNDDVCFVDPSGALPPPCVHISCQKRFSLAGRPPCSLVLLA